MGENNLLEDRKYLQFASGIGQLLKEARGQAARAVNSIATAAYWEVGRRIVEFEQGGEKRAEYGEALLESLSNKLTSEFGRGFTATNLRYMRQFYLAFPIHHALRDKSPTLRKELSSLDIAELTPLEALNKLFEWQRRYGGEKG